MRIDRFVRLSLGSLLVSAGFAFSSHAQAVVSVADGPWNDVNTWSPHVIPDAFNSTSITVNNNVTIPVGYSVTIGATTVNGTLTNAGFLTVSAPANSLVVNGTFSGQNTSSIFGTTGANVIFNAASTYQHQFTTNQGVVPLAQWDANSTVLVNGFTTGKNLTGGSNWSQNFGNFTFQCAGQTGAINLDGLVTSVAGNFTVASTGNTQLYFGSGQNYTLAIGGNLIISGTSRVVFATTASPTINIANDFSFTSTNAGGTATSTNGQPVINIGRDFLINAPAGLLRIGSTGNTGGANINISRDFIVTAGTLSESSNDPGAGAIAFTGGAAHQFSSAGSILNRINYSIAVNNQLTILGESHLTGAINSSLDVFGTLVLSSTNANGAIQTGYGANAVGNVWVQTRTFHPGSIIVYGAAASAQVIGNGEPSTSTVITQINNPAGVSLNNTSSTVVTMGILQIVSGTLTAASDALTVQDLVTMGGSLNFAPTSTHALTINGNLQLTNGNITFASGAGTDDFIINGDILAGPGTVTVTGATTRITVGGSGAISNDFPLAGATTLKAISVTRGGGGTIGFSQDLTVTDVTINSGNVAMHSSKNLTIGNNLNIAAGGTLSFPGGTLTIQRFFNNTLSGGLLSANSSSTLNITGSGTLGTLAFSGAGNTLNTLQLNRATAGTLVTLNSALTITNSLNLVDGVFANTSGLSMSSGATITQTANAAFSAASAAPGGGPYNIIYNNGAAPVTTNLTTTPETTGSVQDVTVNVTGTLTDATALTVKGTLFLNTGTFKNTAGKLNMAVGGTIARNSAATFTGLAPTGGAYNIVYSGTTLTSGNEVTGLVNNFTSNVTGTANISLLMTVHGTVFLNSGTLNSISNKLTMANGSTFDRFSGSFVTGSIPAGGPYNLIYDGTSLTSQVEMQGSLNNVTSNLSGTLTQAVPLVAAGTLFVNSGDWASGANTISVVALNNAGTFDAPSTTLTLTGNLTNTGVFNHNNGTVIFNGVSMMLGAATPDFNNIQLNAGKTVTFPASLNIAGNITFAAGSIFNHGSGLVTLNGNGIQNIDSQGAQFYAITDAKAGGSVALLSALNLANVLSINSATDFASGGFLTVLSQPNGSGDDTGNDGSIGPLVSGGNVTGPVIVQRFIKAKGIGNRYISAAVSGVGAADLEDDFTVMPGSIRFYNEAVRGTIDKGYTNISSLTLPLEVGRGYLAYMYDNIDVQWDVTGTINSGSISLPVTFTNAPNPDANADGWNLAGNPYPSPITWNNTPGTWTRTNVDPVITVYDINGTAFYTHNYTNGAGNLPNGMIATGQSFWVHLNAVGTLQIHETAKISGAGGKFFRTLPQEKPEQLFVTLSGRNFRDNSILVIDSHATSGFDPLYDGFKFKNETMNLYFRDAEGRHLVMNAMSSIPGEMNLPVEVDMAESGQFSIDFSATQNFPSTPLYLIDRYAGKSMLVSPKNVYSFSVDKPGTYSDRFYISTDETVQERPLAESFSVYPNPAINDITIQTGVKEPVSIEIYNSMGQVVYSSAIAETGVVVTRDWSKGMYFVKGRFDKGMATRRIIKQ